MTYKVINHARVERSFHNSRGRLIQFEPGETKYLKDVPPQIRNTQEWDIKKKEEEEKPEAEEDKPQDKNEDKGGEN